MKQLLKTLKSDLRFYGGKSFGAIVLTFFFKQAYRLMLNFRIGNYLMLHRFPGSGILIMYLKRKQLKNYACYFSYKAEIGYNLSLPHPIGIVIGDGCSLKNNITLYQNCTLGMGKDGAYPEIHSGTTIFPNSIIIGGIQVNENVIIGASSFVNKSIEKDKVFKSK